MKKCIVLIILLSITFCSFSQTTSSTYKREKKVKPFVYPSNVLKLNTTSLLFKTIAVQYERKLSSRWALGLGILYRPNSSLVFYDMIAQNSGGSTLTQNAIYAYGTMKFSRICFTPEFRYYFKKSAPRGVYLAPFLRYKRDVNQFDYKFLESNVNNNSKIGNASTIERTIGVGVLFGYQILSKKGLAIDFWFLGPWFGNNKTTIASKLNMANLNAIDKNSIASDLEEITTVPVKYTNTGVENAINKYGGGIRMIGVNIGYNF